LSRKLVLSGATVDADSVEIVAENTDSESAMSVVVVSGFVILTRRS